VLLRRRAMRLLGLLGLAACLYASGEQPSSSSLTPAVRPLLVTGYWPVSGSKYPQSDYASWIGAFARVPAPTLVFCDPAVEPWLRSLWQNSSAGLQPAFVPLAASDFYTATRLAVDWATQAALDPERHSTALHQVWNERPALLLRAAELQPDKTHLVWLDVGIFREVNPVAFHLDGTLASCNFAEAVMLEVEPFTRVDFQLSANDGLPLYLRSEGQLPDRIAGGQLFGSVAALRRLAQSYYAMARRLADAGHFMGKDQIVYNALYASSSSSESLIRVLPPDGQGNPWWTFPRMFSREHSHNGHHACAHARARSEHAAFVEHQNGAQRAPAPAQPLTFRACRALGQANYHMPGWDVLMRRLDCDALGSNSVVMEVGASIGKDAAEYVRRYDPYLVAFEPLSSSLQGLQSKFAGQPKVLVLPYGLGAENATQQQCGSEGSSSAFAACEAPTHIQVVDVASALRDVERQLAARGAQPLHSATVMLSINCEGCEYDLLEALIEHRLLSLFAVVQLSRHGQEYFGIHVPDVVPRYCRIQEELGRTHRVEWMYEWMWERWVRV